MSRRPECRGAAGPGGMGGLERRGGNERGFVSLLFAGAWYRLLRSILNIGVGRPGPRGSAVRMIDDSGLEWRRLSLTFSILPSSPFFGVYLSLLFSRLGLRGITVPFSLFGIHVLYRTNSSPAKW